MIIGIDPGAGGAIALLDGPALVQVWDMPVLAVLAGGKTKRRVNPGLLAAELRTYQHSAVAVVEQVGAMPGQGVSSMFAFGEAYGTVKGVLAGLGIPCQTISPATWKKAMKLDKGKDAARSMAIARWPSHAAEFSRVRDDGRAEAALIALWLHQQEA